MKSKISLRSLIAVLVMILLGVATIMLIRDSNPGENENISDEVSTVSLQEMALIGIDSDIAFNPATIVVKQGTEVKWTSYDDDLNYQIVSGPHPEHSLLPDLKSPILGNNESYIFKFSEKGVYEYHDELHPELNGKVIVE